MSKVSSFAKILKVTVSLIAKSIKAGIPLLVYISKELFSGISKKLRFSITFKAAVTYTLIFSMILFMFGIILVASFGSFLFYDAKSSLEKNAKVVTGFINESTDIPEDRIQKYAAIERINITLYDSQREAVYTTGGRQNAAVFEVISHPSGVFVTSDEYLNLNVPIRQKNNIQYLVIAKSLAQEKLYLFLLMAAIAVAYLLTITIIVVKGSKALQKMLKPIDDMIATARSISARDLNKRLDVVYSHDELKELAETFNEMLGRIQASYEQQNQFVSDASHELRTPISVIQGYANLLQRWGKEEKDVLDESVNAIKNEADSMKDLVEKLLFLARADKNIQRLEKYPFSVNELIDEVVSETKLIDTQHHIIGEMSVPVTMDADRGLIKQALRIFIDNSIKFTQPGGTIRINGQLASDKLTIRIEDTGAGISKENLPFIFNRFYKCDKSRSREDGGTGLGLSIAKWIIEKHYGTIDVDSVLNKCTTIIISLPV